MLVDIVTLKSVVLLDIFKYIVARHPNSHLLLIGKGEDYYKLTNKVRNSNLKGKVSFLIDRADINEIYQTLDVFVLPSLFEGLPVVCVEAQANGLPCFVSSNISKEVLLTCNAKMLDLTRGAQYWAEQILKADIGRYSAAKRQLKIRVMML